MQILQFPDSSWGLTVLKNIFLGFIGLNGLKMVWKKSSLIWNFFPWFWLKTPSFSLISLTGKSLQNFPWIPWFPWSVGTLPFPDTCWLQLCKSVHNEYNGECQQDVDIILLRTLSRCRITDLRATIHLHWLCQCCTEIIHRCPVSIVRYIEQWVDPKISLLSFD